MRLQILDLLRNGDTCVCHKETALEKRQAYISQQLMVLREAGLVDNRKDGLQVFYSLADNATAELLERVLGSAEGEPQPQLEECPFPHCTVSV